MAASDSGLNPGFDDFRRYHDGEMSSHEAHLLEKRMLDDPLVAEAYEGFLALTADRVNYQAAIDDLAQTLKDRVEPKKNVLPFIQYAAAASLIIGIGLVWLVLFRSKNETDGLQKAGHISSAKHNAPAVEDQESLKITYPTATAFKTAPRESFASKPSQDIIVEPSPQKQIEKEVVSGLSELREERIAAAEPAPASAPQTAFAAAARQQQNESKKTEILANLDFSRDSSDMSAASHATPLGGWESYQSYLQKRTENAVESGEVTIGFTVDIDGKLSDFTTKGSQPLYDEAVRIIKDGPAWSPVISDGRRVATRTTLVLHFNKSK